MRIKEMEIAGFKSFVDRVKLSFKPGITALVGPNGCGKSNIIDAMRWIVGEQNARNLRGKTMEDLIFNGSETRKPHGMAEVSLVLTNANGNAEQTNVNEIMVTRRLFRSGESEYFINKTPCRLKDIVELFLDSGIGTKSYSILEQGKVDHILSLKPHERRTLIEEAAGIAKYRSRKKEAVSKMESTKNNLLRIKDILMEMQNQSNVLERQVKRLKRFQKIKEEIKTIDLLLTSHKLQDIKKSQTQFLKELAGWKDEEIRVATQKQASEALVAENRLALTESNRVISDLQQKLYQTNNKTQSEESRIAYNNKEQQHILETEEKHAVTLAAIENDLASLQEDIHLKQQEADKINAEIELLQQTLNHNTALLTATKNKLRSLQETMEKEKAALIEVIAARTEFKNAILLNLNLQKEIDLRLKKLAAERDACQQKINELETKGELLAQQLQAMTLLRNNKEKTIDEQKQSISSLSHALSEKDIALTRQKDQMGTIRSRLVSLQELQKNFEGFDAGVRTIMQENDFHHTERDTVIGLFADMIETSPQYEPAIEVALGIKLQSIIVKSPKDCLDAVEYLKRRDGGRASFAPLDLRCDTAAQPAIEPADNANAVVLAKVVKTKPEYQRFLDVFLGNVLLVENITQAMELWQKRPGPCTVVTKEGEIVDPAGVVTGGSKNGPSSGILQRKRQIRELSLQLADLESQYRNSNAEREQLVRDLNQLRVLLETLSREKHEVDIKLIQEQTQRQQALEELQHQKEKLEILSIENNENSASLMQHQQELKHLIVKEALEQSTAEQKQKILKDFQQDEQRSKEEVEKLESLCTDLKVKLATANEKKGNVTNDLDRLQNAGQSSAGKRDALLHEKQALQERKDSLSLELRQAQENMHAFMQQGRELEIAIKAENEKRTTFEEKVTTGEQSLKIFRERWEEIEPKIHEIDLSLAELSLRVEHAAEEIAEKYHLALEELPPPPTPEKFDLEESRSRLEKLKKRVENIGEVNLAAAKEYDELRQRYDFLHTQEQDLTQSLESLQRVIAKINRTTKQKFHDTFHEINRHFQEIFPILFNGGKAYLQLTDESDLLETGIEIFARPPGKKLQYLDLLSGGERAFTVVALLFAIFLAKPSPFCLLDEIDAALDDINIDRFNKHLQKLTDYSQFIIVTHNKQSMQFANTLYGITMEERGVSKIISVELH